jgi:hypothetical protein
MALACLLYQPVAAEKVDIVRFSAQSAGGPLPPQWIPVVFKKSVKPTRYSLVADGDRTVLRAQAVGAASGLVHRLDANPSLRPVLSWRWRVERLLSGSDISRKNGDDYPARLYVTFAFDAARAGWRERLRYKAAQLAFGKDLPYSGLCYVWDSKAALGTMVPNAYAASVKMIVVESGAGKLGQWVQEKRNIVSDYRAAFGFDPPALTGVAVMTDTDDTHESTIAWYGDITLAAERKGTKDDQ